jgi:dynein heavy chain
MNNIFFLIAFPIDGEVYDYYPNFEKKTFQNWNDKVTDFVYDKTVPYFNILVPTADTVKFKSVISRLVSKDKNVLITGETGVGKSVIINEFLLSQD